MTTTRLSHQMTREPQDAAYWSSITSTLKVGRVPTGALNLNVEGCLVAGPLQGFGQLWQKTFRIALPLKGRTPAEVVALWKASFSTLVQAEQRFYPSQRGLAPGEVILINASMTGLPISTGVMVLYADDESFTLMTPQGHPESGWVTFSSYLEDKQLICEVQTMARANDPLYEVSFRLFATKSQDRIWTHVLTALATQLGEPCEVTIHKTCIDPRLQWSEARNIWHNAALRTLLYTLIHPLRRAQSATR